MRFGKFKFESYTYLFFDPIGTEILSSEIL